MENKKAIDVLVEQPDIEVPWEVWTTLGNKNITFFGNQCSFGHDYKTLYDVKKTLEWYVDQFGGKVKWRK